MIQCVKRKSFNFKASENDDSEDSDYEEVLPSNKRQRISMAAMQRLFAKFSLNDDPSPTKSTASNSNKSNSKTKSNFRENKFRLFGGNSNSSLFKRNNNQSSVPNRNENVDNESSKEKKEDNPGHKRHADEESDANLDRTMPQQKRVRHLKRGLRLCSNITCYIEQIIYN